MGIGNIKVILKIRLVYLLEDYIEQCEHFRDTKGSNFKIDISMDMFA